MKYTTRFWAYVIAAATTGPLTAGAAAQQPPRAVTGSPARPAGAPAAPAPRAQAPKPVAPEYQLMPSDKLRVEVYRDAQLSQSVQVRPDGKITMPLLGDIEAAGRTPIELRDAITTALKEYVNNPVVTVIVVEATAPTAYVVGEVNNPGAIALNGQMTVLQALAVAGGLKDFANAKNIRILRNGVAGVQTIGFNYRDAVKGETGPVYLRPGDTVVVP